MELLVQAAARLPSVAEQHRFSGLGLFRRQGFKVGLREGGSSAKTLALLSRVHGIVACYLKRIRGVEDALSAGIAGCATGLALSTPGTPQALLQSFVSFCVFTSWRTSTNLAEQQR